MVKFGWKKRKFDMKHKWGGFSDADSQHTLLSIFFTIDMNNYEIFRKFSTVPSDEAKNVAKIG